MNEANSEDNVGLVPSQQLTEIRDILDRHYNVKWYTRLGRGALWGLGFGLGSFLVLGVFVWALSYAIRQIDLFPGMKTYIVATVEAVRILFLNDG